MTVGAGCGRLVSIHDGSPVHTLFIKLHRMRKWNLVSGEELRITVARRASVRHILLGDQRSSFARGLNLMHRAMARHARRGIGIARSGGLSVNTFAKFFDLIG